MKVRQTVCRFCGQDIEGFSPFRRGEWRDRGNNTTCPTPEGDSGREHAPIHEEGRANMERLNKTGAWIWRSLGFTVERKFVKLGSYWALTKTETFKTKAELEARMKELGLELETNAQVAERRGRANP